MSGISRNWLRFHHSAAHLAQDATKPLLELCGILPGFVSCHSNASSDDAMHLLANFMAQ
jgi:hypothetical protein